MVALKTALVVHHTMCYSITSVAGAQFTHSIAQVNPLQYGGLGCIKINIVKHRKSPVIPV